MYVFYVFYVCILSMYYSMNAFDVCVLCIFYTLHFFTKFLVSGCKTNVFRFPTFIFCSAHFLSGAWVSGWVSGWVGSGEGYIRTIAT